MDTSLLGAATSLAGAATSFAGAATSLVGGGGSLFGCPLTAFLSLQGACPATAYPPCVTATTAPGSACCSSLISYGQSIGSCYSAHAPSCLDFSSLTAAATSISGFVNPAATGNACAAYVTHSGATAASTAGAATSTSTAKSAAPKVGSLKVYLGVALVGALAGLSL